MARTQSAATVRRLLADLVSRSEDQDFTSLAQDRALRQAVAVFRLLPLMEKVIDTVVDMEECACDTDNNDGECRGHCLLSMAQRAQVGLMRARTLASVSDPVGPREADHA